MMDELISRQAAIDTLATWDWQDLYLPIHFKQLLEELPEAQDVYTEQDVRTAYVDGYSDGIHRGYEDAVRNYKDLALKFCEKWKSDDLISRKTAIEAAALSAAEWDGMYVQDINVRIREALEKLPPAEPERKQGEWIPCSKHNPTKYGTYLVTLTEKAKAEEFGFDLDNVDVRKMRFGEYGWRYPRHIPEWINNAVQDKVIAWMPLPEPYKEEENDV